MDEAKVIVIEGACDGIGKSTQLGLLVDRFEKEDIPFAYHHYPTYGTYQALPVEKYLSGEYGMMKDTNPYFINNLYALDRIITWQTNLKREYENGKTIIFDRYTTSSIIYQSALIEDIEKRKDFINYIIDFEYNKLGIQRPDNVIFLYAPFDLVNSMRLMRNSDGSNNDIHESNIEYMKKVYENALFVADYLSWDAVRCDENNSMRDKMDIHNDICKLVLK